MNYRLLLPALLLTSTFSVHAEKRWFEVELIMFERNIELGDVREQLARDNILIDTSNSISLVKQQAVDNCAAAPCLHKENPAKISGSHLDFAGNVFQQANTQLNRQYYALQRHNSFTPVMHVAWRMPVYGPSQAVPIHLFAGKNYAFDLLQRQQDSSDALALAQNENTSIDSTADTQFATPIPNISDKWAIDGNFKIYLNHYLYVDTQLVVRKQQTQQVSIEKNYQVIEENANHVQMIEQTDRVQTAKQQVLLKEVLFDQSRRLRSEEVHYLDHPLMGIIVQIRKIPG